MKKVLMGLLVTFTMTSCLWFDYDVNATVHLTDGSTVRCVDYVGFNGAHGAAVTCDGKEYPAELVESITDITEAPNGRNEGK